MFNIDTMVIPAAGYGTRMRTLTGRGSKELIEIGEKPALMYALQEALAASISRVGIVIREGKEDIVDAVKSDPRLSRFSQHMHIEFFCQEKPTGEAGAIAAVSSWLKDASFVVYYPDNIIVDQPGIVAKLIQRQAELQTDAVLLTSMLDHVQARPCGLRLLEDDLYQLLPDEMPSNFPYGLRPTGIYIATPHFMKSCKRLLQTSNTGEIKDRDARCDMVIRKNKIYGLNLNTKVLDIGNPEGYYTALRTVQVN